MDVDQPDTAAPQSTTAKTTKKDKEKEKEKEKGTSTTTTAPTSKAPSPKPARTAKDKDAPAKLPQGSGLISNALFGVGDSATEESEHSTPNIILHIPLNGTNNRIVNFARLAEEQYGFAALHPRLAAHKERLARVAAVGAALERNEKGPKGILSAGESADEDLSLDMDRDSDLDGDVAMAGAGTTNTNGATPADGADGKKKRRKKIEEYDRDDPFVDDSEMAWQEHAAASKDGYFVYSGPLVPEGEKVQVERLVFFFLPYYLLIFQFADRIFPGPMELSNEAEAVDGEAAVVHQPPRIKCLLQPLFPFLKKPAYPCAVQDLAAVAPPVVLASARPHASRWKTRSKATTMPRMALLRRDAEAAWLVVEAVAEARYRCQRRQQLPATATTQNWHHGQILHRHHLDPVLCLERSWR